WNASGIGDLRGGQSLGIVAWTFLRCKQLAFHHDFAISEVADDLRGWRDDALAGWNFFAHQIRQIHHRHEFPAAILLVKPQSRFVKRHALLLKDKRHNL